MRFEMRRFISNFVFPLLLLLLPLRLFCFFHISALTTRRSTSQMQARPLTLRTICELHVARCVRGRVAVTVAVCVSWRWRGKSILRAQSCALICRKNKIIYCTRCSVRAGSRIDALAMVYERTYTWTCETSTCCACGCMRYIDAITMCLVYENGNSRR